MLGLADAVTVYVEAAEEATTVPLFWASFGLVCLWYLLFSLPVVVDDLLKWEHEHGRVEDSAGWQLAVVHLRVTLHLSLVLQLLKPLGCNYSDPSALLPEVEAGSGSGYLVRNDGWYAANGTAVTLLSGQTVGAMQGAAGVHCWDEAGPQPTMALAALLALAFYLLTVHVVGDERVLCRARQGAGLDVRYSELYTVVANTLSIVAAAGLGLLKGAPFVLLGMLVGTFAALLLWTLLYGRCIGQSPCCLRSVTVLRASGYALALWAAICCLVELSGALPPSSSPASTDDALRPAEVLLLAGWGTVAALAVGWLCAIDCGARRKRWAEAGNLGRCAGAMRDAEERWRRAGLLVVPWARGRRRWAWRARTAARVGELATCLTELEQHVSPDVFGLDSGFVQGRGAWLRAVNEARTHGELEAALHTLSAAVSAGAAAAPAVTIRAGGGAGAALYASWLPGGELPVQGPWDPVVKRLRNGASSSPGSIRWSYRALLDATGSLLDFAALPAPPPEQAAQAHRASQGYPPSSPSSSCRASTERSTPPVPANTAAGATSRPTYAAGRRKPPPDGSPSHRATQCEAAVPSSPSAPTVAAVVPGDVTAVVMGQIMLGDDAAATHSTAPPTAAITTSSAESGPSTAAGGAGIEVRAVDVAIDSATDSSTAADIAIGADTNAARAAVAEAALAAEPAAEPATEPWLKARGRPPPQPAGLFSPGVCALLDLLHEAATNFERTELVESELRASELSCAEVSAIASTFTFASRKRALLVALYPKLPPEERPGFVDVLEAVLDFDFDRKDVMRDLKLG